MSWSLSRLTATDHPATKWHSRITTTLLGKEYDGNDVELKHGDTVAQINNALHCTLKSLGVDASSH